MYFLNWLLALLLNGYLMGSETGFEGIDKIKSSLDTVEGRIIYYNDQPDMFQSILNKVGFESVVPNGAMMPDIDNILSAMEKQYGSLDDLDEMVGVFKKN